MSQFGKHASFLWRVTDVNYGPLHNHLRRKLWRDCKYSRKVLTRLWTRKYKCWHSTSCKDGSVMYRKLKLIFDQVQRWRAVSRKPTFCGCVHRRIGLDRTARLSKIEEATTWKWTRDIKDTLGVEVHEAAIGEKSQDILVGCDGCVVPRRAWRCRRMGWGKPWGSH